MEYGKYLVMISHLEGASNGRRPNQVVPPHSSGSTPMFRPTVTKRDMPRNSKERPPKFNVRDMPETHDRLQISCQILTAPMQ